MPLTVGSSTAEPQPERGLNDSRPVFYYDLGSPYAYLTAERIPDVLPAEPRWQPILLGAVFKAVGRSSWALGEGREAGMAEVERRAARAGLPPVRWPEPWPGNTLTAMRSATWAQEAGFGTEFARAAFRLAYAEGRDLSLPEEVLAAAERCGADPDDVRRAVESPEVKGRLRAATDDAVARGVTGVPTVAVGERLFWGDDRLEDAAHELEAGPSPVPPPGDP